MKGKETVDFVLQMERWRSSKIKFTCDDI